MAHGSITIHAITLSSTSVGESWRRRERRARFASALRRFCIGAAQRAAQRAAPDRTPHNPPFPSHTPRPEKQRQAHSYSAAAMGIHGLTKLLGDNAPEAIKENK